MAKFTLAPPPIRDRMVDDNGIATRPYQVWLSLASLALGGSADLEVLQAFQQDPQDASEALQEATVQALTASEADRAAGPIGDLETLATQEPPNVGSLRDVVEELKQASAQSDGTASPLAPRVDALEILLASIQEGRGPDAPKVIMDTHANRVNYPAAAYEKWFYYETNLLRTDRQVLYLSNGIVWIYVAGIMRGSLSPDLKPVLDGGNEGFLFWAEDYAQLYQWNGLAWNYAPGGASQYIVAGSPQGGLWWLCDGATRSFSQNDGSIVNITTPDLTGDIFIKGASSTGSRQTATIPTLSGSPATASGGSHSHTVDPASEQTSYETGTAEVQSGTGVTVAAQGHFHDVDISSTATSSDGAHTHTISAGGIGLQAPSESVGGLPLRIALSWYMRR